MDHLRLKFNSTVLIFGSTNSGKSTIAKQIIENEAKVLDKRPDNIICIHAKNNGAQFESLKSDPRVKLVEGVRNADWAEIEDPAFNTILLLDDQIQDISLDKLNYLAQISAHHCSLLLIVLLHEVFNSKLRTLRLNSAYYIITKMVQDRTTIRKLAQQLYPRNVNFLSDAYADATATPWGYLLLDLHNMTPDSLRVRTHCLGEAGGATIYEAL